MGVAHTGQSLLNTGTWIRRRLCQFPESDLGGRARGGGGGRGGGTGHGRTLPFA